MGEPKSPSGRTIGPFRAFEACGTLICPQDTIVRTKEILTKVIVLKFRWPVKERWRKHLRGVRDAATKPETGSAPANPLVTPNAHLHPSRCTKTRTATVAHLARGFIQPCRKDT